MIEFAGRLHPIIVHLPVGILLLAACLHFLDRFKKFKSLIGVARIALLFGSVSAVVACITGIAKANDSYDTEIVTQHKYLGIATALVSLILLLFFNTKLFTKKSIRNVLNSALFFLLLPSIIITGHLGASLTHGSDFLLPGEISETSIVPVSLTFNPDSSIYSQLIRPLFQHKCYECHSSRKQKGKLRLDTEAFIMKGGKSGSIVKVDETGETELLYRIHLPIEDEDHMPPSDNEQLSSGEIDLLTSWIESGAPFNASLLDYPDSGVINRYLIINTQTKTTPWWPLEEAPSLNQRVMDELAEAGVVMELLSENSNYVQASFVSLDSIAVDIWNSLLQLENNLISLRFSGVKLSQLDIDHLSSFPSLRRLYLDGSIAEPLDLNVIFTINELRYLNLSSNTIDYDHIRSVQELKHLEQLVIFNTNINNNELELLKNNLPNCRIESRQYNLEELPTDTLTYRRKK